MRRAFFLTVVVSALLLAASPGADQAAAQQPDLSRAIEAQERHTPNLLNITGILGTGVGLNAQGVPVIRVYLQTPGIGTPPALDNIPVERIVTGRIDAQECYQSKCGQPIPLGTSTGHPDITAGTIGARVTDGTNVYALSNNHVFANSNNANEGDNILQPGPYDGGQDPADTMGTLADFEPITFGGNNTMDAAIALMTSQLSNETMSGYIPSTSPKSASVGMEVKKTGRTTALTFGTVAETNVTVVVCYEARGPFMCAKSATFVEQFTVSDGSFSAGGDSGSLIVTNDANNNPVGLLFAGSSTRTIANPIGPVLARFGVSIDNSSTTAPPDEEAPTAPVLVSATAVSSSRIDLDWDAASDNVGVASYKVYRDGSLVASVGSPQTTYSDTGLDASTTYSYYVMAVDAVGNESAASNTLNATTSEPPLVSLSLSVSGYKVKGVQHADLSWSGSTAANVDIWRNGLKVTTTVNDGAYTDNIGNKGGGNYTYKVCEAGTSTCSTEVTITF